MIESQVAADVLMIRPVNFCANSQTADTNHFQNPSAATPDAQRAAVLEFDRFAEALRKAGVRVHVFRDRSEPITPDSIFPNNWVSFHADGTVVLYPMLAPNRRLERRRDILDSLVRDHGFIIDRVVDLTSHELQGRFLEGTGSMVLDRRNRIAYACLSPRTDRTVLDTFASEMNYEVVTFDAVDSSNRPIYHTNVILSIGSNFAVVGAETIPESQRARVVGRLSASRSAILELTNKQIDAFAGNMLELASPEGRAIVAMSTAAHRILTNDQRAMLRNADISIVAAPLSTIETLGGGSARCMLAELHLPVRG